MDKTTVGSNASNGRIKSMLLANPPKNTVYSQVTMNQKCLMNEKKKITWQAE